MRNIGPVTANRIFHAVADYLGVSEETLESDEIRQVASLAIENPSNPLKASIAALDLPPAMILSLQRAGVFLVEQLIKFRASHYEGNREFGSAQAKEIDRALKRFLKRLDESDAPQVETPQAHGTNRFPLTTDLKVALDSLGLDERVWSVVELRAIRLLTLEKIRVEIGGVSKERVRQILDRANEKIHNRLSFLLGFCDYLDERATLMREEVITEELTLTALSREFERRFSGSTFVATKEDLRRLIAIIRLLVISEKSWVRDHFQAHRKDLAFLVCLAEPPFEKHEAVRQFLEAEKEKRKGEGYKELAYRVLAEAKSALHWTEIVQKARQLNKQEKFAVKSLYNALFSYKNLFVKVGQGTYELAEWGNPPVKPYPGIIASVLTQENQAMPFDLIFARVSSLRSIKPASLKLYLDTHPRFYRTSNKTYGLRGWLPPKEKQDLLTPEWLMEDSYSFRRVERAKARGVDLDKLIAEDKLK